jgi:hypothetical protein
MQHFFSFINDAGKQKVLEIKLMPRFKPFPYLWGKNIKLILKNLNFLIITYTKSHAFIVFQ